MFHTSFLHVFPQARIMVKHVTRMVGAPEAPPLVVLALTVQTLLNPKRHCHEVIAISGVIHRNVSQDNATAKPRDVQVRGGVFESCFCL
jgi:hypothetical protein